MRDTILVTGSAGLIGSETARFFHGKGFRVIGIDNDLRKQLFGPSASTYWNRCLLQEQLKYYQHHDIDIRDRPNVEQLFQQHGPRIGLIVHAAAQPSHDWAARDPHTDFTVNANGTLILLECFRHQCPDAVFIFTSTNKVYGDTPNTLPLIERDTRWEIDSAHPFFAFGIDETMSTDRSKHSLFGASKLAADVLVQEYGRYFRLQTAVFRGGCLTGPSHSGTELHGFLAFLMKCAALRQPYTVFGYKGKQVRDNIHSRDLVDAFWHFFQAPRAGEVYNIGGGRFSNCSILEAIELCHAITGNSLRYSYCDESRSGDHLWWISDTRRFSSHFPCWRPTFDVPQILEEIYRENYQRWRHASCL